jgi:hypothetical protein
LVTELNTFIAQVNTLAASLNAVAAGTALSIPLKFSTTTTVADPGAGYVRLNNATQNLATVIRLDLLGSDGSDWTAVEDLFDDSTSTIKGFITLKKASDATKFLIFSVSALASPSGYKNITVACVAYSSANPFALNDDLLLEFTRNGDKGDPGATGNPGANGTGVIQQVSTDTTAVATGTTTMPFDDTVPQITEGDEYMTVTITPQSAASTLIVEVTALLSVATTAQHICGAIFRDAGANSLGAAAIYANTVGSMYVMHFSVKVASGSTAATTFRFRAGRETSNTVTFNGVVGARKFGAVAASSIRVREVS